MTTSRVVADSGLDEFAPLHAERAQMLVDDGIVDELSEDGDGGVAGGVVRGAEGVAHAEAHAVMSGEVDVHGWFGGSGFGVEVSFVLQS